MSARSNGTELRSLGEFGLIKRFRRAVKHGRSVVRGIGEDCAVIDTGAKDFLLLTTDMLVQGIDFTRSTDPALVGRKAMAVSISDIAACAGTPRFAVACVGLPRTETAEGAMKIFRGMKRVGDEYGVDIVGGDLSVSPQICIAVTLTGTVEKKLCVYRDGAEPGDRIFVTGAFGGSIRGKHLRFVPRVSEARYLARHFGVSAMIDSSDGLAADLGHILSESGVGALIRETAIPRSKECRGLDDALHSGEDFELIFTVPQEQAAAVGADKRFTEIGSVTEKKYGFRILDPFGRARRLRPAGFQHFKP